jgi:hypothetical protein
LRKCLSLSCLQKTIQENHRLIIPSNWSSMVSDQTRVPWTLTVVGWSGTASIDRNGNWYWSLLGLGAGKAATGVSGSITANWLDQRSTPTPSLLNSFLTTNGLSAAGGFWGGATESYTPGSGFATGVGIVSPQIGASYNYSFKGGSFGHKAANPEGVGG